MNPDDLPGAEISRRMLARDGPDHHSIENGAVDDASAERLAGLDPLDGIPADDIPAPDGTDDTARKVHAYEVGRELSRLRVREEAKRLLTESQGKHEVLADSRLVPGGEFIFSAEAEVPSLWGGTGGEVLWAKGEPFMITGPTGAGKTTLCGQVVAGRLGLLPEVLGFPVAVGGARVLYLAMDRPAQISRALGRLMRQWDRDDLDELMRVWRGPPPVDLARNPRMLLELAQAAEADTVIIDSLKDAAIKLADEETGQGINLAQQLCCANGVEVLVLHHQTKRTGNANGGKPNTLADVYGSTFITAGCGSVVLLWGAAGDPIVELSHLKQPASEVGPFRVLHNHELGTSSRYEPTDVLSVLGGGPKSARELAAVMYQPEPTDSEVEKCRRKLERMVVDGVAVKVSDAQIGTPGPGRRGGGQGARYGLAVRREERSTWSNGGPRENQSSQVEDGPRENEQDHNDLDDGMAHEINSSVHGFPISADEKAHGIGPRCSTDDPAAIAPRQGAPSERGGPGRRGTDVDLCRCGAAVETGSGGLCARCRDQEKDLDEWPGIPPAGQE